ncbi:MAG: DUF2141 domain-containing protein [Candidatus Falkowbacteria bacterium]
MKTLCFSFFFLIPVLSWAKSAHHSLAAANTQQVQPRNPNNPKDTPGFCIFGAQSGKPFDSAAAFPKTLTRGVTTAAAGRDAEGRVTLVLRDVAPGSYALSAYHDLDGNGQLNTNLMGMPTEPYGFANNARGSFGPPSFQAASVALPEQGLSIELKVQ